MLKIYLLFRACRKLKILKLEGMPYLKNPDDVRKQLTESLPNTKIELK